MSGLIGLRFIDFSPSKAKEANKVMRFMVRFVCA